MRIVGWIVVCALLLAAGIAAHGSAAKAGNVFNGLSLEPRSTLLAIIDSEGRLTSQANSALFEKAGFQVDVLASCGGADEAACVKGRLVAYRARAGVQAVVLMASARHSNTVYALYGEPDVDAFLAAAILFRANEPPAAALPKSDRKGPPLLLIGKGSDPAEAVRATQSYSDRMRSQGIPTWFYLLPEPGFQLFPPGGRDEIVEVIYRFTGAGEADGIYREYLDQDARWQEPPFENRSFHELPQFISSHPVDKRFTDIMGKWFQEQPYHLKRWRFDTYKGFDLLAYRDSNPQTKGARYLLLRNLSGNFDRFDLEVYAPYKPKIVIGFDDTDNMFSVGPLFYLTQRQYSWAMARDLGLLVRPLGAFLHFEKPVPPEFEPAFKPSSNLGLESISFSNEDPFQRLDGVVSADLKALLTRSAGGCVACHAVGDIGGAMYHISAAGPSQQPGFALALQAYREEVLEAFLFDQARVAALFGDAPNFVPEKEARELFEYVKTLR